VGLQNPTTGSSILNCCTKIGKGGGKVARGKAWIPLLGVCLTSIIALPSLGLLRHGDRVTDGDTIKAVQAHKELQIPLCGIDYPEKGQPFSKRAKQFSSEMVFGKIVEIHRMDSDRY